MNRLRGIRFVCLLGLLSCKTVECGSGTVEKDGKCIVQTVQNPASAVTSQAATTKQVETQPAVIPPKEDSPPSDEEIVSAIKKCYARNSSVTSKFGINDKTVTNVTSVTILNTVKSGIEYIVKAEYKIKGTNLRTDLMGKIKPYQTSFEDKKTTNFYLIKKNDKYIVRDVDAWVSSDKCVENPSDEEKEDPRSISNKYNKEGLNYHNKDKNYKKSSELFQKAIDADPTYKWPYYNLACAKTLLGETGAEEMLKKAIEMGGEPMKQKAIKDKDFDKVRTESWFVSLTK